MSDWSAWLAAMPVEGVRDRIRVLERELEVLRLLEVQHRERIGSGRVTSPVSEESPSRSRPDAPRTTDGLSPQRRSILILLRQNPEGMSPARIAHNMGIATNAAQTTLSRMVKAGQVVRAAQGIYQLPPEPVRTLPGGAEPAAEGAGEP